MISSRHDAQTKPIRITFTLNGQPEHHSLVIDGLTPVQIESGETVLSEESQITSAPYVTIAMAAQMTGLTQKAIRRKIEEGKWLDGREYRRSSDGGIYISIKGYTSWLEQGSMHEQDQFGSRSRLMASKSGTR